MEIKVPGAGCSFDAEHQFIDQITASQGPMQLDMQGVGDVRARILAFIVHYSKAGKQTRFKNVSEAFYGKYASIMTSALSTDFGGLIENELI